MPTYKDSTLIERSIDGELWREYEWDEVRQDCVGLLGRTGKRVTYRIINPVLLYIRPGGPTHRVVDSDGVAHCVPAVGLLGCIIRWKNPPGDKPVNF